MRLAVRPTRSGLGRFELTFRSHDAGFVQVRAVHYATPQQAELQARSPGFRFVWTELGPGAAGQ